MKKKFTFILSSGKEINFNADDITITKRGNELTGYEIIGGEGQLFYCKLEDISAIIVVPWRQR